MQGDCLERIKEIPDGTIDLILCDLPYGTIKGMGENGLAKEKGYSEALWDSIIDTDIIMLESSRILRKNGKMCLFAQQPFTNKLINSSISNLPFSYSMIWEKDHFSNCLSSKKAMVNYYEDILLFSKKHQKHDFEGHHPLRSYFSKIMYFIGLNIKQINTKLGHRRAEHTFYINSTQYSLCTEKTYRELIDTFKIDSIDCFIEFGKLKEIDFNYRAELLQKMNEQYPSTFNLWSGKKFKSNILKYKKDYEGLHPTQKPVLLLEDLVKTFSNEGETVLDFTMGSGSTGVACVNTGRKFIGIELDENYFNIAKERIAKG
jgi:site-specific DNA-methyltransferase (adenine-specific)